MIIKYVADVPCLLVEQETQLSQRDRAMLRVIDNFAKSLKITQCHVYVPISIPL